MESQRFVGLIGLGYWGKNILRNLHQLGVLRCACDSDPRVLTVRKENYPDIDYCTSFDDILRHEGIEAVAIVSPAATHYELVKKALLGGKDVFVEKPLALTVEEGEHLVSLASRHNRILMVGHILQYHPAVLKLKELISAGELGKVQYIYSNRLNIGKLRTEENILWSFAPHDISVILMLLEEEPLKISAFGGDYLNNGIQDTTLTTLEFRNGVKAHIFVSWLHPFKEQKLIVVGSKAMAVFDDLREEKLCIYPHTIEWQNGKIPIAHKADCSVVAVDDSEPLRKELIHFVECVRDRTKPRTDGTEGLRVLKIIEASERHLSSFPGQNPLRNMGIPNPAYTDLVFIHQSSVIDKDVEIGRGSKVWHFSHVLSGSKIGEKCIIAQNVMIGPDVEIGNRCKIQNNVSLYTGVKLEDEVFCGPSCVFTNVYNPRAFIERKHEFRPTLVRRGAAIGANATIVCGTTIGEYAMIGAGAVVKSDVPDHAIVVGAPARQVGWACRCGTKLRIGDNGAATCTYCGDKYQVDNGKLALFCNDFLRQISAPGSSE